MQENRKTLSFVKNGEGTLVSLNLKGWQAVASLVGASAAAFLTIWGGALYLLKPQVTPWIEAEVAPVAAMAQATANTLALHQAETQVSKAEIKAEVARVRERSDDVVAAVKDELRYIRQRVDEIARGR